MYLPSGNWIAFLTTGDTFIINIGFFSQTGDPWDILGTVGTTSMSGTWSPSSGNLAFSTPEGQSYAAHLVTPQSDYVLNTTYVLSGTSSGPLGTFQWGASNDMWTWLPNDGTC